MSEDYFFGADKEDTTFSTRKNKNQLGGRMIPQTDKLFLERVQLLLKMLREPKKEAITATEIHLQISLDNNVIQSTEEIFHKAT